MPTSCGPGLHSRFSVAVTQVGLDQHSYSTLGPVSAWVGDRLWMGKPPRCRTRHPGLLSLIPPSVSRLQWVSGESWGSEQAYRVIHQTISVVSQCSLNAWLKGLASGDQCRLMANGSTLEVCYTLMHYTNPYLLYLTLHDVQLNVAQTYVVQRNNSCQQYTVTVLTVHLSVSLLQQYTQPTPFYTYHTSLEAVLYYTSASVRIWVVNFVLTC